MKEFFKVTDLDEVLKISSDFNSVGYEEVPVEESAGRVLAQDILSDVNLPEFSRSTMDGYAVRAKSTFGASDGSPAFLNVTGRVAMGEIPDFSVGSGEAAKISTGGMLPDGADSVVMIEYVEKVDDSTIEVFKSVAPAQHIVEKGEDYKKDQCVIKKGVMIRPQETGLLAAFGFSSVKVFEKPVVGIISTGDEIVAIDEELKIGQIRDINSYSLASQVKVAGGVPVNYGIVKDSFSDLQKICEKALSESHMVLISGGSSVGTRDFTIDVLNSLDDSKILVHGITISPGKPTILANAQNKPFWGLPGHVVSAMVVFDVVVKPFLERLCGLSESRSERIKIPATLSRNVHSAQGRVDFIRVKLIRRDEENIAEPVLGKSGLINTMVKADGIIKVDLNTEGLDKGSEVFVKIL